MTEEPRVTVPDIDLKHILLQTFAQNVSNRPDANIVLIIAGGMLTGRVQDTSLLEKVVDQTIKRVREKLGEGLDEASLAELAKSAHTIELQEVEFIPFGAPNTRFRFAQIFVFPSEVTAVALMGGKGFPPVST